MTTPAEARQDLTRVVDTLHEVQRLLAGHDQVEAAVNRLTEIRHSPLRTAIDHAVTAAERVLDFIGNQAAANNPTLQPPGRDGGPM